MRNIYQKTITNAVALKGVGLHSGKTSNIKILPANSNDGITFRRVDLKKDNLVFANYESVSSAKLCTTLENQHGVKVSTVEHLLAALYIAEVDNAIIEIDSEEVPIMDGSAKDFLDLLKNTEIKTLSSKRKFLKILEKVELIDGERKTSIEPNKECFEVDFQINFENKIIGNQKNIVNFQKDNLENIVNSRTFCLFKDIEKIKKAGLAQGGSLDNAIVVDSNGVLNEGGLRNKKEFVNHKILDLAGDFLLSGYRILGKVVSSQGGHELSNMFLRKLLNMKNSYEIIELNETPLKNEIDLNQPTKIAVNA
ncbi:UDP-3-O-acyl-N-acetylglucosamine deacetylase [Pelagibacteraceae bacterium]|jgi:UDP-3-O-[3-hydroxymyristoyl] N-acetylglucosamine deacetylase|nr:UDP-3-O-acyl-N-acetylglucosamine deacetylase [Pelagibacteraceae bacterium]